MEMQCIMAWTSMPAAVFIYAKYNNYDILIVSAHYGMDKYVCYCCFYLH